jgi:uncharacterized membrane protein YqgA involved in biofilm formation
MVKKVGGSFYLKREEVIDYILAAYPVLHCSTKWSDSFVVITILYTNKSWGRIKLTPYKIRNNQTVYLSKAELDFVFFGISN